jgi:hypothetical protein
MPFAPFFSGDRPLTPLPGPAPLQVFNILCEHPETVAAFLVPRMRSVVARGQTGTYTKFLTIPKALSW